jgi:hypothetical protein
MTDNDKEELRLQAETLLDLDEPEALLASLKRAATRKAATLAGSPEAKRWQDAATALERAQCDLNRAGQPPPNLQPNTQQAASQHPTQGAQQTQSNPATSQD